MQRNLLMIGTSNTIRRGGFVTVLHGMGLPFPVRAVGLGGTPSVLLPYMLSSTDLAGVTHLAMDPADNAQARSHGDSVSSAVLWHTVDWLRACGIVPVLLITPQITLQDIAQAVRAARRAEARARGVAVVDGYELIEDGACDFDMLDDLHVGPALCAAMMERLASVVAATAPGAIVRTPPPFAAPPLDAPGAEAIERRSSMRVQRYILLRSGQAARFSLPARGIMVGISLNFVGTHGRMRITSDEAEHVRTFKRQPAERDGKLREFVHRVAQLPVSVPGQHFTLCMEGDGCAEVEAAVCYSPPPPVAGAPQGPP